MSKTEDSLSTKDVSISGDVVTTHNDFKRHRSFETNDQNLQTEKRTKRESDFIDEFEIRDKLLEELSSNVSYQDAAENMDVNQLNENQQPRKIIKVEGELPKLALPEGWIALNHRSGGIIYLHRTTRVCTWARPYYIGKGSVRKHDVPIAAVPCLHQTKALSKNSQQRDKHPNTSAPKSPSPTNKHTSVLNFLNTAGSDDNQMEDSTIQMIAIKTPDLNAVAVNDDQSMMNDCAKKCDLTALNINENIDSKHLGCTDNQNVLDRFNPKDGLDVVNDTLNFTLKENHPKGTGSSPTSSTELNLSQTSSLKSTSFESNLNQEPYNGHHSSQEGNVLNVLPQSAKSTGNINSTNREIDASKVSNTNFDGLIKQHDKNMILKSSVTDCPVDDHSKTNPKNNGTHLTTGVELIDAEALSGYLSKLFEFEEITVKQEQNVVQPSEQPGEDVDPALSSALECLPYCVKGKNAKENKGWVLNPGGKTPVAILHEYCQAVIKEKPVYVYSECDNSAKPFMAEVQINGITHGTGVAPNKKQAKQIAAEIALEVLIPNEYKKIRDHVISREELECFDKLKIDSPNIYEVSIKSGLPTPSQVLQECLKRNQGVCSSTIRFKIVPGEFQNHTFTISCGKHSAEGKCKNKKIGKQLASQALLMKLHPYISTWGSLLRIYCDRPSSIVKKYKTPDEESLSNCISTPDTSRGEALLAKLKEEMMKIADNGYQGLKYAPSAADLASISTVDI